MTGRKFIRADQFGERVRVRRIELGISMEALTKHFSEHSKKSSLVRNWEAGIVLPNADNLVGLAMHLDCSVDWLLGLKQERQ